MNLCPNPGAEAGADGQPAGGWYVEGGTGIWADDQVHSGKHSLKIVSTKPGPTTGWTSTIIPTPPAGGQLVLSVWAKLSQVTGDNGAFIALYHTDAEGVRIGQSGELTLGGVGQTVATTDWQQYVVVSRLIPEVKGVRVNLRLYGAIGTAWFDDVVVQVQDTKPLTAPRPLRRGLRMTEPGAATAPVASVATAIRTATIHTVEQSLFLAPGFVSPAAP